MNIFELDLLHFHGKPQELHFQAPKQDLDWLFENAQTDFSVVDGSDLVVELRASLIDTTVRITGTLAGSFEYQCGKCLENRVIQLDSDVEFVLMSQPSWRATYEERDEVVLSEEDMDVSYYSGDIIDLRPLIREAVLLELPPFALCDESIAQQCEEAYQRHVGSKTLEKLEENQIDLRWSALRNIQLSSDSKHSDEKKKN